MRWIAGWKSSWCGGKGRSPSRLRVNWGGGEMAGEKSKPLERREEFFDRDGGVAKNPTKSSEGNFGVKWNGDW